MAYTLIGGTAVGTVLILLFLPSLNAAWFRIRPRANTDNMTEALSFPIAAEGHHEPVVAS